MSDTITVPAVQVASSVPSEQVASRFDRFLDMMVDQPDYAVLLIVVSLLIWLIFSAQFNKKDGLDFRDLIRDTVSRTICLPKTAQLVALLLSSWGFITLVLQGKLSEEYFLVYMAVWAGSNVLNKWIETRYGYGLNRPRPNGLKERVTPLLAEGDDLVLNRENDAHLASLDSKN